MRAEHLQKCLQEVRKSGGAVAAVAEEVGVTQVGTATGAEEETDTTETMEVSMMETETPVLYNWKKVVDLVHAPFQEGNL